MAFCDKCKNKVCLALKKPCEVVEAMLPKIMTGRLKREFSFEPDLLEKMASNRAFELRYGKKYAKRGSKSGEID